MTPNLSECVQTLLGEGYLRIAVLPMFIARGGHLKHDLPKLITHLREQNPGVSFELAGAIGEAESVVQAMADHALTLAAV